jgi:hypothetical protein
VVFETNSKNAIDTILFRHIGSSEFSYVIIQIKNLLFIYSNIEVKFIKRQTNMLALTLATTVISGPSYSLFELCPPCIETLLFNERRGLFFIMRDDERNQ